MTFEEPAARDGPDRTVTVSSPSSFAYHVFEGDEGENALTQQARNHTQHYRPLPVGMETVLIRPGDEGVTVDAPCYRFTTSETIALVVVVREREVRIHRVYGIDVPPCSL